MEREQGDFHGIVLNLSQKNRRLLSELEVLGRRNSLFGLLALYKVRVPAGRLEDTIVRVQRNMARRIVFFPQEFYAHFYRANELIVVFRDDVYRVTTDRSSWGDALDHGRALGISEKQLDFSPCRFEDETY